MSSFWLDESTDRRYYEGRAFSYGEINYTKAGAVPTTFADLGFVQVTVATTPDARFYYFNGPNDDGSWNVTEKRLEDEPAVDVDGQPILNPDGTQVINYGLKTEWSKQQLNAAYGMLQPNDWYVVRKSETGTAIPVEWETYRTDVRTVCGDRVTAIEGAADFDAFVALVTNPAEIPDPNDPDHMIPNPEPHLEPWPISPGD